jgi:hypothetical protein
MEYDQYEDPRAETVIERGDRVMRAEDNENELHQSARQAVVTTRANMAIHRRTR